MYQVPKLTKAEQKRCIDQFGPNGVKVACFMDNLADFDFAQKLMPFLSTRVFNKVVLDELEEQAKQQGRSEFLTRALAETADSVVWGYSTTDEEAEAWNNALDALGVLIAALVTD